MILLCQHTGVAIVPGAAFLLSQVGTHSSRLWHQRMAALGLEARHAAVLRFVASDEGRSQQALADQMRLAASRVVALVDELEAQGMIERRAHRGDRRIKALYLTRQGRKALDIVMRASAEHEAQLTSGLNARERKQLIEILNRIVPEQGLTPGVHPALV